MSLAMLGQGASYEFRWRRWALLRDAVAGHLEDGRSGSRFAAFASIGQALGVSTLQVPAAALADELRAIRSALADRTIDDLLLGPATASVLYPTAKHEGFRPLTRTELAQVAPPGESQRLDEYFASMLDSMLEVCASPAEDGTIEVYDG